MVTRRIRQSLIAKGFDEILAVTFLLTIMAGLIAVYSTSSMIAANKFGSGFYFLRQQAFWALISVVAVVVLMRIDLRRFSVYSPIMLMGTIALLTLVFLMPARNASHRWLFLGPVTIQPSELFKFVLLYYLAFSLSNPSRDLTNLKKLLMPYIPLVGSGLLLILLEPNLSTVGTVSICVVAMFFLAGARIKHLAMAFVPVISIASIVVFVIGYKRQRVFDYIAAIADPLQGGYQAKQAALTIGSGQVFGTGIGEGLQKLFFLPYPHTDFIFAAIGEEVGFVGLAVILVLLFTIIYRGLRIAFHQPDKFGYLLAAGMTLMLFVNIAINIAVVTSLIPVTGLPLPFISYGGSSLLISSAAVGVLLNLSRREVR